MIKAAKATPIRIIMIIPILFFNLSNSGFRYPQSSYFEYLDINLFIVIK